MLYVYKFNDGEETRCENKDILIKELENKIEKESLKQINTWIGQIEHIQKGLCESYIDEQNDFYIMAYYTFDKV